MARHSVSKPRYVERGPVIGHQPDLFGGPIITHEVPRRPIPRTWGRDLLRYHLADHIADLDMGGEQ